MLSREGLLKTFASFELLQLVFMAVTHTTIRLYIGIAFTLHVVSSLLADPRSDYGYCGDTQAPPCWIDEYLLDCIDDNNEPIAKGAQGEIYRVQRYHQSTDSHEDYIYALKIGEYKIDEYNQNILSETKVTQFMSDKVAKDYMQELKFIHGDIFTATETIDSSIRPSIYVYAQHSNVIITTDGFRMRQYAMLMDHHSEIVSTFKGIKWRPVFWRAVKPQKNGIVFKFLFDASFVLMKMWNNSLIDRDVKIDNFVMDGDLNWREITFIKIDYGVVIREKQAQWELSSEKRRSNGFCHFGTHVKSLLNL